METEEILYFSNPACDICRDYGFVEDCKKCELYMSELEKLKIGDERK